MTDPSHRNHFHYPLDPKRGSKGLCQPNLLAVVSSGQGMAIPARLILCDFFFTGSLRDLPRQLQKRDEGSDGQAQLQDLNSVQYLTAAGFLLHEFMHAANREDYCKANLHSVPLMVMNVLQIFSSEPLSMRPSSTSDAYTSREWKDKLTCYTRPGHVVLRQGHHRREARSTDAIWSVPHCRARIDTVKIRSSRGGSYRGRRPRGPENVSRDIR